MRESIHPFHLWGGQEHVAGVYVSINAQSETVEARSPIQAATFYDEVDARLMDTFPASDAVGRY
jgi:hypothetical protein